jgi:hypothetical protein
MRCSNSRTLRRIGRNARACCTRFSSSCTSV